jgi:hypothetical protein
LLPGGRLLAAFTARTEGDMGSEWLLGELWASVLDLVDGRVLDPGEAERAMIPIGLRRLDDVRRPFSPGNDFEGLIAERIETETGRRPALARIRADRRPHDLCDPARERYTSLGRADPGAGAQPRAK